MVKKIKKIIIYALCVIGSGYAKNLSVGDFDRLREEFRTTIAIMQDASRVQLLRQEAFERAHTIVKQLYKLSLTSDYSSHVFSGFSFAGVSTDEAQSHGKLAGILERLDDVVNVYRNLLFLPTAALPVRHELADIEYALREELIAVSERQSTTELEFGKTRDALAALRTRYELVRAQCSALQEGMQNYENYFSRIEELLNGTKQG